MFLLQPSETLFCMWELFQTIQPEVEMFWGNLSQQTLIKLSGHVVITLRKKRGGG